MFRSIRTGCLAMAAVLVLELVSGDALAQSKGRLSANRFLALDAFIIPMMPEGDAGRQFTLVVALELKDEDDRDFIKNLLPVLRSRTYDLLFRLIAYRTTEPFVPSTQLLKKKMFEIAVSVLGDDKVDSIVVQQVYQGRTP